MRMYWHCHASDRNVLDSVVEAYDWICREQMDGTSRVTSQQLHQDYTCRKTMPTSLASNVSSNFFCLEYREFYPCLQQPDLQADLRACNESYHNTDLGLFNDAICE